MNFHRPPSRPTMRRRLLLLIAGASVLSFAGVGAGRAQSGRSARDVAALVQSFYDQSRVFEADFQQQQFTKVHNTTERASGHVVFEKPGRMRWDYAEPNGQVFVSDGSRLVIYQPPEEGESRGQVIEQSMNEHQLPQAFSFLTGTGRLDEDFTFRLLDAARHGFRAENGYVLELRPREATPHYDRIHFFVRVVEQRGRSAGVIQRVLILDDQGNRNRFDFTDMSFPRDVPDSRFRYQPPANARRVRP